jgi:hypothetical protein
MKYEYFDSPIHEIGSRPTENISKNEELFLNYGKGWWIKKE